LQNAPSPPVHLTAAIISRLKIMAELDIAERRLPQDGRIRLRLQNRRLLKPIVQRNGLCAMALTEPGAGSDVAAMTTTARRDGDS